MDIGMIWAFVAIGWLSGFATGIGSWSGILVHIWRQCGLVRFSGLVLASFFGAGLVAFSLGFALRFVSQLMISLQDLPALMLVLTAGTGVIGIASFGITTLLVRSLAARWSKRRVVVEIQDS